MELFYFCVQLFHWTGSMDVHSFCQAQINDSIVSSILISRKARFSLRLIKLLVDLHAQQTTTKDLWLNTLMQTEILMIWSFTNIQDHKDINIILGILFGKSSDVFLYSVEN